MLSKNLWLLLMILDHCSCNQLLYVFCIIEVLRVLNHHFPAHLMICFESLFSPNFYSKIGWNEFDLAANRFATIGTESKHSIWKILVLRIERENYYFLVILTMTWDHHISLILFNSNIKPSFVILMYWLNASFPFVQASRACYNTKSHFCCHMVLHVKLNVLVVYELDLQGFLY